MSFSRKLGIASVGTLALLIGLGLVWREGQSQPGAPPAGATSATGSKSTARQASESASPTEDSHAGEWKVGASRTYSVDFGSRLEANEATPDAWFSIVGSAALKLTRVASPAEQASGDYYLRGELSSLSVVLENEEQAGQQIESRVEKSLDKPFLLRVSESGRIRGLGTQSDVTGMGYNILRSTIATLQFVEPSGKSPSWASWLAEESDQNGVYQARYKRLGTGSFEKTKLGYSYAVSAGLAGTKTPQAPTIQSRTELAWSDGKLAKAHMVESMVQPLGDDQVFKTKTHTTLELVREGKEAARPLDTSGIAFLPLFESKMTAANAQARLQQKRELVGGRSFGELHGELAKLTASEADRDARWKLAERLTALMELDPTTIGAAIKELKASGDTPERDMLLAALADVDSPDGRNALADLARDRNGDRNLRETAVTHLGVTDKGSVESIEALQGLARDPNDTAIHTSATLALGSAAHAGARTEGVEAASEQAVQTLSDGYKRATSPKEQRMYLDALGNAGSDTALDAVRGALSSPDASVRAAAADSLRRVPGAEADNLLAQTLRNDAEPKVRAAAIAALNERQLSEPLFAALGEGLRNDKEGSVRLQILSLLGQRVSLPAVRTLLSWAASNDPDEKLRSLAAKALKAV